MSVKSFSVNFFFITKSRQKLQILNTKEDVKEPWGLIELQVMAAPWTHWTSLYLDTNSRKKESLLC